MVNPYWERCTTPRSVAAGEVIFREGEPAETMYYIVSGKVAASQKSKVGDWEHSMRHLQSGDWLGDIALLRDEPHPVTVKAIQSTELLAMTSSDFWNLMATDDHFRRVVLETLLTRQIKADESCEQQETLVWMFLSDLRSPLQAISGMVKLLQERSHLSNADYDRIISIGQRTTQLIQDWLNWLQGLLRLTRGDPMLDVRPVNVAGIIEQFSPDDTLENPLRKELPQEALPTISADQILVEEAIHLLIKNAARFTREGEVIVRAWSEGDKVWVAADDSGPGIPAKEREELLDKPYALLYPRLVAEAHGGELRIEDRPDGQGSRVSFSLPIEPLPQE